MTDEEKREYLRCFANPAYFIHNFCYIYDATESRWVRFELWGAQASVLKTLLKNLLVIILKARQLGMTWLCLGFALWLMLFRPAATILLFSKTDDEAVHMLDFRLKGMYERLPNFLKSRAVVKNNAHEWVLANGSMAKALATTRGDSYTVTYALVDEADLVPNLDEMLNSIKPTIDAGGRLTLLSRSNKKKPQSTFKRIYRGAIDGANTWAHVFLAWWTRPGRTLAWYEEQKRDFLARTVSLDGLFEQYPAVDTEALDPATQDKRIPSDWLRQCYEKLDALSKETGLPKDAPTIPNLRIYRLPEKGRQYIVSADPAEGNPTSDDSSATVLDKETGEEVAAFWGRFQPDTFASYLNDIAVYFNRAEILCERNNHGHAVLLWLREHSKCKRTLGLDGREGWNSTSLGKAMMYDACAEAFRERETILHTFETRVQLALIEGSTLKAPEGEHDDLATSYALGLVGIRRGTGSWVRGAAK